MKKTDKTTSDDKIVARALLDVLASMGFDELEEQYRRKLEDENKSMKLKHILSPDEINEIQAAMIQYEIPSPTGFAHALGIHGLKCDIQGFDIDRVYSSNSLWNLSSTLRIIGITNENIFSAIRSAIRSAQKYGL